MSEPQGPLPKPIFIRPPEYVRTSPFEGDLFERKALSEKLTDFLTRLKDGCVIGIDAPWGDGKTWFARNWEAKLSETGFKTVYLDAFERDYSEDPFVVITAEILSALEANEDSEPGKTLWRASKQLGKALLPSAAKITINTLGRLILGTADLGKEMEDIGKEIDGKAADATEKYIESRLKGHDLEKQSVEKFRAALAEYAAAQENPVIFFVDELDRCRPTFSVQVIERIKHFFDVPNLVFVLMLNRDQLERAINGVYGQSVDAHAYLGKFVHLFFALPKRQSLDTGRSDYNWIYCWEVAKRYKLSERNPRPLENFIDQFSVYASSMALSLRDVEKAMALFAMSNADESESAPYLAWPIALKLKKPQVFAGILKNNLSAHQEAIELLDSLSPTDERYFWSLVYFHALHTGHLKGFESLSEEEKQALQQLRMSNRLPSPNVLNYLLKRLDIAID